MRKMKDSGIEWIGEIPESWSICKLKNVATIITGNTPSKSNGDCYYADEGMMWVKPDNLIGSTPITETNEYLSSEGIEMARVVSPHTPLVCCIGSIGKIGISEQSVAFNQQINAVDYNESVDRRYGLYYLMSQEEQHKMRANGNVLLILNSEQQGLIPFLLPPREVQTDIALYLDKKCAEIDALIAAKERTNALLRERRQSIIYEAVTKGLNPDAPMKDSGIEWIGMIPESWDVVRIKHLRNREENSFEDGDWIEAPSISETGIRYLTTGNIGDGNYKEQGNGFVTQETFDALKCKYAYPGDLVFSRLNAPYGRSCILPNHYPEYVLAVDNVILRTDCCKKFLCYLTQCTGYQRVVEEKANGTTMKRISRTNLGDIALPIPTLEEQEAIAMYLDTECVATDSVISANEETIQKLKEYRQSIIYEAVTGKIEI